MHGQDRFSALYGILWQCVLCLIPYVFCSPHCREELSESAYKHQLLGLNLLFLLSQNRVAEFHTELERLPAKDIQTNVYIKHPVSLEQVGVGGDPHAMLTGFVHDAHIGFLPVF